MSVGPHLQVLPVAVGNVLRPVGGLLPELGQQGRALFERGSGLVPLGYVQAVVERRQVFSGEEEEGREGAGGGGGDDGADGGGGGGCSGGEGRSHGQHLRGYGAGVDGGWELPGDQQHHRQPPRRPTPSQGLGASAEGAGPRGRGRERVRAGAAPAAAAAGRNGDDNTVAAADAAGPVT